MDTSDTVHLRCGSDIFDALRQAGMQGQLLEFSDPLCQGPARALPRPEWITMRTEFVQAAFGHLITAPHGGLASQYHRLDSLPEDSRVVLWFEHDPYDQIILTYLLDHFSHVKVPQELELVCVDQVPGVENFRGLGQLDSNQLAWLWRERRVEVDSALLLQGKACWQAFTEGQFNTLLNHAKLEFPILNRAMRRMVMELPHRKTGLSWTQHLILELLSESKDPNGEEAGTLFRFLNESKEPLPFLGDIMFAHLLHELTRFSKAPLRQIQAGQTIPWFRQRYRITKMGTSMLNQKCDLMDQEGPERWLGGLCLRPGESMHSDYRWDFEEASDGDDLAIEVFPSL